MDSVSSLVTHTKVEPHLPIWMDEQRNAPNNVVNFSLANRNANPIEWKDDDKIKCAEIFRCTKSNQWKFSCFLCIESFEAILDFVSHLENHFTSDEELPPIEIKPDNVIEHLKPANNLPADTIPLENSTDTADHCDPGEPSIGNDANVGSSFTIEQQQQHGEWLNAKSISEPNSKRKYSVKARFLPKSYELSFSSYTCDICQQELPDKHAIYKHLLGEHKRTKCKYCDKRFNSQSQLTKHQQRHENASKYQCDICARRFRDERGLTFHMRKHSGEKSPYICDICQKTFTRSSTLRVHIQKQHFNNRPFQCSECGLFRGSSSELATHMRRHWIDKPYKCEICTASFVYPWKLKEHTRMHSGEKPLQCSYCAKTFARNRLLKQHENIHTGKLNYPCRHCDKKFSQAAGRRAHEKHVHKVA